MINGNVANKVLGSKITSASKVGLLNSVDWIVNSRQEL
jgi:hypothetical protein